MPARLYKAEGPQLYGNFLTGTIDWAEATGISDLAQVYGLGYLPYSGDTADPRHLFYNARSLRVNLTRFSIKKKRRYDHRTWLDFGLQRQHLSKEAFVNQYGIILFDRASQWMEPRFGEAALPRERLRYILEKPFLQDVMAWRDKTELAAFALVVSGEWGAHYWYVFYRNGGNLTTAPGHGFLVDFLTWCHTEGLPYAYLGTAYAGKSMYKSRGISGAEFWDGRQWNPDMDQLTRLQGLDDELPKKQKLAGP